MDWWWKAVRDFQQQSNNARAGELLFKIGELMMQGAGIEPFHMASTRSESASAAYDAYVEAAKEIKVCLFSFLLNMVPCSIVRSDSERGLQHGAQAHHC